MESPQSGVHYCGAEQTLFGVQCGLEFGHDGPHEHTDEGGTITWEPTYVAAMRRDLERFQEALSDLAHEARRFSTEADYTVSEAIEDEFTAALGYAEQLTGGDSA